MIKSDTHLSRFKPSANLKLSTHFVPYSLQYSERINYLFCRIHSCTNRFHLVDWHWMRLTEINDKVDESAGEQDKTARLCSLILLYTLCKINPWPQTTGRGLKIITFFTFLLLDVPILYFMCLFIEMLLVKNVAV